MTILPEMPSTGEDDTQPLEPPLLCRKQSFATVGLNVIYLRHKLTKTCVAIYDSEPARIMKKRGWKQITQAEYEHEMQQSS